MAVGGRDIEAAPAMGGLDTGASLGGGRATGRGRPPGVAPALGKGREPGAGPAPSVALTPAEVGMTGIDAR